MKIILSGYGRMGKEVEQLAAATRHQVLFKLNSEEDWQRAGEDLKHSDVVIDFSWPSSAVQNIRRAFDMGLPVVIGTTGWDDQASVVRKWCQDESRAILAAANFSIGVNMMLQLAENLSRMADRFKDYDISIEEIHHIHKLDAPSGTAIRLAETVIDKGGTKLSWSGENTDDPSVLNILSVREGEVPGTHKLKAESGNDILEIIHRAKSRRGFAAGALLAAEWIQGRSGFFTMKDLLEWTD